MVCFEGPTTAIRYLLVVDSGRTEQLTLLYFLRIGPESPYPTTLKKVDLTIVPNDRCQEELRKTRLGQYFILDSSFLCAGGHTGADTCEVCVLWLAYEHEKPCVILVIFFIIRAYILLLSVKKSAQSSILSGNNDDLENLNR
jgi:hypothetical protein